MNNLSVQNPAFSRTRQYNQILNEILIDPLGLNPNILEDIPEWSNDFQTKFISSITKDDKTIKKYFSELGKFLKKEDFPATANLREYITLDRINKNEEAGRSMYYVKRIWKKISPKKQKNSHHSSSMETNQPQISNQHIEEEVLHSNHEDIFFSEKASQKGTESNGMPYENKENPMILRFSNSSLEFQNNSRLLSEHSNEQNSIQNDNFNFFFNEQNSVIGASSQSPNNEQQQISIQNNNNNFTLGPNISFSNHSFQLSNESNVMPNNGPNRAANRPHSKTLDGFLNLVRNLWPQVENYLRPERYTGEIVWRECCRKPTRFCYYEEKRDFDTSNSQTHEGRCGERKDKGKVFICIECYFRRFGSRG